MFHVKDGLFFERIEDGSVRIVQRKDAKDESPIVFETVIEKDPWASVIATVSKLGENYGRFFLAEKFHNGDEKCEGYY